MAGDGTPARAPGILPRVGERTAYTPGTFCWTHLATTDADAARRFYGDLLGWEGSADEAMGGYALMSLGGSVVGGVYPMTAEERESGALPGWLSIVSVDDVDACAARVTQLGGRVVATPMDVMSLGRTAVVADPQGAAFGIWQPGDFVGAGVVNDVGAMVLNQLNTNAPGPARDFYAGLFGWDFSSVADGPMPYWGITNGGSLNGGVMALDPSAPAPPHWLVYFTVEDLDASDAVIVDGGGAVVVPPMTVPGGRILVAHDPQYAFFALFEGDVDD